jgi:hypothetical protein
VSGVQKEDNQGKSKEDSEEYEFNGVIFNPEDIDSKIVSELQVVQKVKFAHDSTLEASVPSGAKAV